MSKREKTTEAVVKAARLNPATSQYDRDALKIVTDLEAKGFNFKQVAVDAILRAGGHTPEMYERQSGQGAMLIERMESLFERFAEEILEQVKSGRVVVGRGGDDDGATASAFTRNFARGFLQRQQQGGGDDE